jgi:hypothetical protein
MKFEKFGDMLYGDKRCENSQNVDRYGHDIFFRFITAADVQVFWDETINQGPVPQTKLDSLKTNVYMQKIAHLICTIILFYYYFM